MKAKEKRFLHFLEGSDKHFVIPVYQRNYDWKKEHCIQLYNDLIEVSKNDRTHFLGSIVSIYHDDGDDREYLIIDGQQRLTTISLLLLAIYKLIDENKVVSEISKEQIRDEYLINKYSKNDKKIRLKPVKNDKNAFSSLFKEEADYLRESNVTLNFYYFYNKIQENEISIDVLFSAIKQLVIVEIELKKGEDDPQLIFESLNSTGLDLTEADKVRNFVLMKETSTVQEEFYNNYWNKIELNTNYNVSDYIRHYLTIKERVIPNKDKVYLYFKNYVTGNISSNKDLLKDLLKYSSYYKRIIDAKCTGGGLELALSKVNRLESIVTYPFIMEAFDDCSNGIIREEDLEVIIKIIISFVFRRLICEIPPNALNKIFMVLGRRIKKYSDYKDNYVEIFKRVITLKKSYQRFPDDDEFSSKILIKDIYNFKNKNRLFLLEQLENFENKERVDVENLVSTNELTVEHIMPQTLSPAWRESLGEKHAEIKERYLNTIGNITLTGYNSEMSNKVFSEKRDMNKGFKESRLFLNNMLSTLSKWDESTIKQRANNLKDKALLIWKYPESNYKLVDDNTRLFTLDDDDKIFTGERIISFKLMENREIEVDSWKEFYKKISLLLYELDPIKFREIAKKNDYIYTGTILKGASKIDDFYLSSSFNVETFLSRLRVFVQGIGLNLDEVSFIIEEKQDVHDST
ncbi:DUF262 domain-containing protein [Candidatus Haliotispira prima]|uniref:DUF262 domain-containing protein n=1 Tax=Candidatus Haliotispira prima TaxID=3034016 RepID=A0ABY8MFV8_9SPIO|nr:DUF262 domain-containing protein [Candidatus Haliotispira prima]